MKKRLIFALFPLAAIVLELSPWGAVCNFGNPEGAPFRETYSYFSLIPFGYANFGPFLTALLSCAVSILALVYVFLGKEMIKTAMAIVSFMAMGTSLMPLLFGVSFFSLIGVLISVAMFLQLLLCLFSERIFK